MKPLQTIRQPYDPGDCVGKRCQESGNPYRERSFLNQ